jgi:hypothetical protein
MATSSRGSSRRAPALLDPVIGRQVHDLEHGVERQRHHRQVHGQREHEADAFPDEEA